MPAPTTHDRDNRDNMARVIAAAVLTWMRTILTEVGGELLRRAELIAAEWASR
jgi:hypothetical protein